jgi:hypothetical protein
MTEFTGWCGILGCHGPIDWSDGPGLCDPCYQAWREHQRWEVQEEHPPSSAEDWAKFQITVVEAGT